MIDQALKRLRPGSQWSVNGDTYSGIIWLDQEQTKPTQQEVSAEIELIKKEKANSAYQRLRAAAYPPITDYLDAVVKSDQAQIDKYIQDCLAVKAQYPKPE